METAMYVMGFVAEAVVSLAPFFLLSIAVASLIKTFKMEVYFEKAFRGRQIASVPVAAGTGAFSPLCSCGVIPAIAAMLAAGIPMAPIMAFWITSPLMSPESFVLTYSILGREMAVARLVATLVIGLVAGYVTLYLTGSGFIEKNVLKVFGRTDEHGENQASMEQELTRKELTMVRLIQFILNMKDTGIFIGKYILIAFFLEALITRYLPMTWVAGLLGNESEAGPLLRNLS